jgi:hypothetical protein
MQIKSTDLAQYLTKTLTQTPASSSTSDELTALLHLYSLADSTLLEISFEIGQQTKYYSTISAPISEYDRSNWLEDIKTGAVIKNTVCITTTELKKLSKLLSATNEALLTITVSNTSLKLKHPNAGEIVVPLYENQNAHNSFSPKYQNNGYLDISNTSAESINEVWQYIGYINGLDIITSYSHSAKAETLSIGVDSNGGFKVYCNAGANQMYWALQSTNSLDIPNLKFSVNTDILHRVFSLIKMGEHLTKAYINTQYNIMVLVSDNVTSYLYIDTENTIESSIPMIVDNGEVKLQCHVITDNLKESLKWQIYNSSSVAIDLTFTSQQLLIKGDNEAKITISSVSNYLPNGGLDFTINSEQFLQYVNILASGTNLLELRIYSIELEVEDGEEEEEEDSSNTLLIYPQLNVESMKADYGYQNVVQNITGLVLMGALEVI